MKKALFILPIMVFSLFSVLGGCGSKKTDMENDLPETSTAQITSAQSTSIFSLPDSGQTLSYLENFGEDHDYTLNPMSYTDNGDGTITDNVTGLIWQKEDDNSLKEWNKAKDYCNDLDLAGSSDWRLPEDIELMSIVDYGKEFVAIDTTYFPATKKLPYWTATNILSVRDNYFIVNFGFGDVSAYHETIESYVRCVRNK